MPTHLHVFFGGLLPFLGHGARSHGVGEETGDGEDDEGSGDNAGREEEDLAALIGGRGSSWAVRAEGDIVGCKALSDRMVMEGVEPHHARCTGL